MIVTITRYPPKNSYYSCFTCALRVSRATALILCLTRRFGMRIKWIAWFSNKKRFNLCLCSFGIACLLPHTNIYSFSSSSFRFIFLVVCLLLPLLFIVFYFCFLAHWMGWWCRFSFGRCFVSLFFGLASMCAEEWRKYNDDKERSDVRFCRSRRPVYEFSNKMKCALLNHCKTADP